MKHRSAPTKWHKLDNTANLFPVVANQRVSNVFRLTAVLSETVDAALLQQALEQTLPYFAAFCVRLRHGLFWSYLETNRAKPVVAPEDNTPCNYIDPVTTNRFLFRVLYYKNRVHLETFHALTDGTGAMRFLKAICYAYCKLTHPEDFTPEMLETPYGVENAADTEDGYLKNYVPVQSKTFRETSAYHLRGERRVTGDLGVITALASVQKLKEECHRLGVSISEYITAAIGFGVYEEYMCGNGAKRPVNLFVPVNLRNIFHSETSLNFFSNITVELPMRKPGLTFEDVLKDVKTQFEEKLTKDALAQKLAFTARSETNLFTRVIPLPLKNGILRIVYEHSNRGSSMVFSNLGQTKVEPEFARYFEGFRFLLSITEREPVKCTACSYGDVFALTFTSELENSALQKNVVRRLTKAGVPVTIESNDEGDVNETL